jgi:hypothetical protein
VKILETEYILYIVEGLRINYVNDKEGKYKPCVLVSYKDFLFSENIYGRVIEVWTVF